MLGFVARIGLLLLLLQHIDRQLCDSGDPVGRYGDRNDPGCNVGLAAFVAFASKNERENVGC